MISLETLGGARSEAYDVSADGSIVVGSSEIAGGGWRAFRWTVSGGLENLNETYAALLTPGSYLERAYGISPNGRYIVGYGYNAATRRKEGYLLDAWGRCAPRAGDVNNDGCVDDADLLNVLFDFGVSGDNLCTDLNQDSVVDDADLLMALFEFGSGC